MSKKIPSKRKNDFFIFTCSSETQSSAVYHDLVINFTLESITSSVNNVVVSKMSVKGQDLLSLCAVAAENEHLIVTVGKFALNMALSPNRAAYGIAKNIAGLVYSGIASKKQENLLTPTNSRYNNRRVSAGDFIQNEMNGEQKQKLITRISNVLGNKNQNSFSELLSMIINNPKLRSIVLRELKKFLESEKISCSRSKAGGCCCNDDDDDSEEDDSEDDDDYYDAPTCCSSRSKSCSRY